MRSTTDHDPLRQLAESTEESVVRENFDAHNAKVGKFVSVLAIVIASGGVLAYTVQGRILTHKFAASVALLVLAVATFRLCTKRGRFLRRAAGENLSAGIVGLLVAQLIAFGGLALTHGRTGDVAAFATAAGWGFLALKMPLARRVAAHAALVAAAVLAIETAPRPLQKSRADHYAPLTFAQALAMLAGGWMSRRTRRRLVAEWSERRTQAREQLRMRDELEFAREVQLSMLPEAPPQLPWLDIAAISVPATEVGGDYFDFFRVGERLALVCGDVAGHGLASGIVLTALRSGFTLMRESLSDPGAVLTRLHELVEQTSRRRMLATAAVITLDPGAGRARIASAGHPPVMVRSGRSVSPIELFAPPLGVRLPIIVAQTELSMAPGDAFVLHSDGVYEALNSDGDLYGLDRLALTIANAGSTAAEIRDAILSDVEAFRGAAAQMDDVTVVVAVVRDVASRT